MERRIHDSARKHGIADDDINHAMDNAMVWRPEEERFLYLGSDRAGMMLEVISVITEDLDEIVIHAMPMRRRYEPMLRGHGGTDA
ncbi:MAG: hypothetical protein ACT452_18630 [Microthrixaceae bacterium]